MVDFKQAVLDKSYQLPIVVDFWAPWCGPCRVLSPIIEKIAEEQAGKWELIKIDTEEQPEVASTYHIRSIPNVKLFYRGEVIHEFLGSLPRQAILDWLRKALPGEGVIALDHLMSQDESPAIEDLRKLMNQYPESEEIRLVLAQFVLWDHPEEAEEILLPIRLGSPLFEKASFLRDIIAFLLADMQEASLKEIQTMLLATQIEEAMPKILSVLAGDDQAADGKLAKATIGMFSTLGLQHPLTKQYRKQLDMYLWK